MNSKKFKIFTWSCEPLNCKYIVKLKLNKVYQQWIVYFYIQDDGALEDAEYY